MQNSAFARFFGAIGEINFNEADRRHWRKEAEMLTKSVLPLIALVMMISPARAKQACTVSEVERLVAQE